MVTFLKKFVRDPAEKAVTKIIQDLVPQINALEEGFQKLDDDQLSAKTGEFRGRLERGETLDDLMIEAFALVREVARRRLGQRHYDM